MRHHRPGRSPTPADRRPDPGARRHLRFAAAAVVLSAADTYVVVVALPAVISGVGVGLGQLQRATPVVSGFLLGYVVVLPLIGRLADQVGRLPVIRVCLAVFAAGSVITATAHGLGILVTGRALQGLGGGGTVPVTVALVADTWPSDARGLPLGVVSALQELGAVVGPLYGAAVVALAGWRWIFWLNLPLTAVVAAGLTGRRPGPAARTGVRPAVTPAARRADLVGVVLAFAAAAVAVVALDAPRSLADGVATGSWFVPAVPGASWDQVTTPAALAAAGLAVAFCVWEGAAAGRVRVLVDLRATVAAGQGADLPGAALLAVALSCVVLAFSTADPGRAAVGSDTVVLGPLALVATVGLVVRQRRAAHPLVERVVWRAGALRAAVVANLAGGAALIAVLVDVPLFARATTDATSQTGAALVLLRFLAAVPVGAVAGGLAVRRRWPAAAVAGAGFAAAAGALGAMTTWSASALTGPAADGALVVGGLGFGLVLAPLNATALAAVPDRLHGLAAGLVVVARTVGMLVGISVLTSVALHRFYRAEARIGSPLTLCPTHPGACPRYDTASTAALIGELHTVFAGGAVAALAAAATCAALRRAPRPAAGGGRRAPG